MFAVKRNSICAFISANKQTMMLVYSGKLDNDVIDFASLTGYLVHLPEA
jgi:hypothetical protein